MPDWRFQPCDFPRMAFLFQTELTRMDRMTSENVNAEIAILVDSASFMTEQNGAAKFEEDLRFGEAASRYSRSVPGNLARTNEVHKR